MKSLKNKFILCALSLLCSVQQSQSMEAAAPELIASAATQAAALSVAAASAVAAAASHPQVQRAVQAVYNAALPINQDPPITTSRVLEAPVGPLQFTNSPPPGVYLNRPQFIQNTTSSTQSGYMRTLNGNQLPITPHRNATFDRNREGVTFSLDRNSSQRQADATNRMYAVALQKMDQKLYTETSKLGVVLPDLSAEHLAPLKELGHKFIEKLNSANRDTIAKGMKYIAAAAHSGYGSHSAFADVAQDVYKIATNKHAKPSFLTRLCSVKNPSTPAAASLQHCILEAFLKTYTLLNHSIPTSVRLEAEHDLQVLSTAQQVLNNENIADARTLLDPLLSEAYAAYLSRNGVAPCATAEGIARELNRPLPGCGTGASQALPNLPDIECGTAAGIASSKPREQGCLIDNRATDIPACGTGLVEDRVPEPLPCNWSKSGQHLPELRSIEAELDLKRPLEKKPIKITVIDKPKDTHIELPMPLEKIQKILDAIDDTNNNLVNNAEIKKILESAPEVMKQFIEKALQECPQLTREQLECMAIKLVNTEHIFGFDRRIFQTPDGKLYIKVEGFHLDHANALEKSGLIKIINRVPLEGGAYRADIMINNIIVKRGTTFFPAHWTPAQVIQKVLESLKNSIEIRVQGKWIKIRGITADNLEIHTSITDIGSIYTTMPAKDRENHE